MIIYGYIRTSRDQEPGHPGSDPDVQRRQLIGAGVDSAQIYADVAVSGAKGYNSRDQWHLLDQQLARGDVLVVAAIDRLGRRYLETIMIIYGYIRTSRDQEPGHPGSDPDVQRRQLVGAGVDSAQIYADVAVSGAKGYNSRDQWHLLDQQLARGDVLVVAAIDRLGRRYLETMWAIYDLQHRGIRLRSLACTRGPKDAFFTFISPPLRSNYGSFAAGAYAVSICRRCHQCRGPATHLLHRRDS